MWSRSRTTTVPTPTTCSSALLRGSRPTRDSTASPVARRSRRKDVRSLAHGAAHPRPRLRLARWQLALALSASRARRAGRPLRRGDRVRIGQPLGARRRDRPPRPCDPERGATRTGSGVRRVPAVKHHLGTRPVAHAPGRSGRRLRAREESRPGGSILAANAEAARWDRLLSYGSTSNERVSTRSRHLGGLGATAADRNARGRRRARRDGRATASGNYRLGPVSRPREYPVAVVEDGVDAGRERLGCGERVPLVHLVRNRDAAVADELGRPAARGVHDG